MRFDNLSEQDQSVFSQIASDRRNEIDERNEVAAAKIADAMAEHNADNPEFDDAENRQLILEYLQNNPDALYTYLVRGAVLQCRMATHIRKLNLPLCHAIYTGEIKHPIIHAEDAVPNENVMFFGHCHGTMGEQGDAETIDLEMVSYDKDLLPSYTGTVKRGYKCNPQIIDNQWQMTHRETRITRNGQPMSESNAVESVTGASFLMCRFGGLIEPLTSGQENEETDPIG